MDKLKPMYDAAKAADAKVQGILNQMLEAFESGTEEGITKAVSLRSDLDAAKAESEQANTLYISARDAQAGVDENARRFVPVADAGPQTGSKQITRTEYEAMDYAERHAYLKSGGAIVDNPA